MSETANQLQFSINESIWFQDGQEAEEIMSIALEPDIRIEENDQYVLIKGSLRLNGEYKPDETAYETNTDPLEQSSYRTMDSITETDVDTALFEHHFPVDITVPANRIDEVDDVLVSVETFDYTLKENNCIQLEADVAISGLVDREAAVPSSGSSSEEPSEDQEAVTQPEGDHADEVETDFEPVSYSAYRQYDDEENDDTPKVDVIPREEEEVQEEVQPELDYQTEPTRPGVDQGDVYEAEPPAETPFKQYESPAIEVGTSPEVPEVDDVDNQDSAGTYVSTQNSDNALYLTKMLSQDDENEQFSKVKMCIVQNGESLESISERYKVPVTAILRKNELETDILNGGQVLYIPVNN